LYRVVKFFAAEGLAANGRIKFAGPNRRIRRRSYELKGSTYVCEIFSLSPSDHEIARSYKSLSDLMPQIKGTPRKPLPAHPNDTSVVLSVRSGYVNVLLGADLEETNDEHSGWRVIIASEERPAGKASVFKVPHHGSGTSDNPNVWKEMLESEPHAILTPYKSGKTPLPQPKDIERILKYTSRAYLTSPPRQKSRRPRSGAVGKTMYETVRRIWTVDDSFSQIQLRRTLTNQDSEWLIRLGDGALKLSV
jgi:hypothetical protein